MQNSYRTGFNSYTGAETASSLTVQGKLPSWLLGVFVHNGPAKFEVDVEKMRHWFDGFALLSKFTFHDNGISYLSKYIRSDAYTLAMQTGKIKLSEFATNPKLSVLEEIKSFFSSIVTDNANVNTMQVAGELIAMTETWQQMKIDLDTLDTKGHVKYKNQFNYQITSAHPHYDFMHNQVINFAANYSIKSEYYFLRIPKDNLSQQMLVSIPVKNPAYIHSFSITEKYVILVECPLVINPIRMLYSNSRWGKPFIENFDWIPQQGTRFYLVDKVTGKIISECETESFFMFHTINAYEEGQEIILDISGYDNAKIIDAFYLDKIQHQPMHLPNVNFRRYKLPLKGGYAKYELMSDNIFEFPRINYLTHNGRYYQFAYGASKDLSANGFLDRLIKIDHVNQIEKIWQEDNCYPGEPVFIAAPQAKSEDEGVIITMVFNAKHSNNFLLLLDARSFDEIARAHIPERLPFGLHGQFYF